MIMKKNNIIYSILGFSVLFFGLYYLLNINPKKGWDLVINSIKTDSYNGKVVDKYYDRKDHNSPTLVLSSNRKITLDGRQYYQISLNDSVSKKNNSTMLYVYKKDKIIEIDLIQFIKNRRNEN